MVVTLYRRCTDLAMEPCFQSLLLSFLLSVNFYLRLHLKKGDFDFLNFLRLLCSVGTDCVVILSSCLRQRTDQNAMIRLEKIDFHRVFA